MSDELVIDETNFSQYFKDIKNNKPEKDEILARYRAKAYLVDGVMKKDLMNLLMHNDSVSALKVMRKLGGAIEEDAFRVLKNMSNDLLNGVTPEEVEKKEYEYTYEAFYFTKPEYFPENDPHWTSISIKNNFLEKKEDSNTI
jgi:hypothetical protein